MKILLVQGSHSADPQGNLSHSSLKGTGSRADFTDSKVILYGHNMKDGSMFSNLKKFQDAGFRKE